VSTTSNRNAHLVRLIGLGLAAFPLMIQIPFGLLASRYHYPAILQAPADEILTRFHQGGPGLVWIWFAYALCVAPFFAVVSVLPGLLDARRGTLVKLAAGFGLVSAATQLIGLLRWTFLVPWLAQRYVDPSATVATREAIAVAFEVQHRLFGALLGEHVGQLTLGIWTILLGALIRPVGLQRALRAAAFVAGGLFLLGLSSGVAHALGTRAPFGLEDAPLAAFLLWSAWAIGLGVRLLTAQGAKLTPIESPPSQPASRITSRPSTVATRPHV
jgi:hypothetical protein